MVKRPIFALFLTISIIIILVGIALIIAIQIDRGYVLAHTDQGYQQEQDDIIRTFYDHRDDARTEEKVERSATQPTAPSSGSRYAEKPASAATDNSYQTERGDLAGSARHPSLSRDPYQRFLQYEQQWLARNPWSPDYNPTGRR